MNCCLKYNIIAKKIKVMYNNKKRKEGYKYKR